MVSDEKKVFDRDAGLPSTIVDGESATAEDLGAGTAVGQWWRQGNDGARAAVASGASTGRDEWSNSGEAMVAAGVPVGQGGVGVGECSGNDGSAVGPGGVGGSGSDGSASGEVEVVSAVAVVDQRWGSGGGDSGGNRTSCRRKPDSVAGEENRTLVENT